MNVESRVIPMFDNPPLFKPFQSKTEDSGFNFAFGFTSKEFGPWIGKWTINHVNRPGFAEDENGRKVEKIKTSSVLQPCSMLP